MFQDDLMMSVLSGIVLMIAIGTVVQRADLVQDYFGADSEVVLNPDIVDARANRLLRIDVLKNDEGVAEANRKDLKLVTSPECGRVFVQGAALQFLPNASCIGDQRMQYTLDGHAGGIGEVVARMHSVDGKRLIPARVEPGISESTARIEATAAAQDQLKKTKVATADIDSLADPETSGATGSAPIADLGTDEDHASFAAVVGR